jgi:hypothetical protein
MMVINKDLRKVGYEGRIRSGSCSETKFDIC